MPKPNIEHNCVLIALGKEIITTPFTDKQTGEPRVMRTLSVDYRPPGTMRSKPFDVLLDEVPEWVITGFENGDLQYTQVEVLITNIAARARNTFASLSISGRLLKVDGKVIQKEDAATDTPKAAPSTSPDKTK